MMFGGIEPLSLSDYENEISTVLFTIGCPFRCKFCYNVDYYHKIILINLEEK